MWSRDRLVAPIGKVKKASAPDPLNSKAHRSVKDTQGGRRTYLYNSSPQVHSKEHRPQSRVKLVNKSEAIMRNGNISRSSEQEADRSNAELNGPHKLRTCVQSPSRVASQTEGQRRWQADTATFERQVATLRGVNSTLDKQQWRYLPFKVSYRSLYYLKFTDCQE